MRGLNIPAKRHTILREIQHYGVGIIFLQETHLSHDSKVKLYSKNIGFGIIFRFNNEKGKRGSVKIRERKADHDGRFLFLKGELFDMEVTLANIY